MAVTSVRTMVVHPSTGDATSTVHGHLIPISFGQTRRMMPRNSVVQRSQWAERSKRRSGGGSCHESCVPVGERLLRQRGHQPGRGRGPVLAPAAADEHDHSHDNGYADGRARRYDDLVHVWLAGRFCSHFPALRVRDCLRCDVCVFQRDHADDDAFLEPRQQTL